MAFAILCIALSLLLGAVAQTASPYTDPITGILFQSFSDDSGYSFGIVLPEESSTDCIGQLVAPHDDGAGWAGVSLGGGMVSRLLAVAWPNGDEVVASLRQASGYTNPSVFSGNATMTPIDNGTFVNSTHFSYTFLCTNCLQGGTLSLDPASDTGTLGWALASEAVSDATNSGTALLYHSAGFGIYGLTVSDSKSSNFATYAAMASASPENGNSTSPGNTTTPTSPTNTTIPVSNSTYDYIVAGAGAAGIIVAERLAESGAQVLLIERGQGSTYASGGRATVAWNDTITQYDVPALGYYLTSMQDTSEYCDDTASQAGCILGGGTMVNALMWVKPQERDFDDNWPEGWKWTDVAAAADRLYSRNPGTTLPSSDGNRYDQGAFDVMSSFLTRNGWSQTDALENPNDKHQIFSHPPWSIIDGERAGPVVSYLPLAQKLSNFHLSLNTKVIRAVRTGSSITGVEVETGDGQHQIINVKSKGKVLLAAGALSTPRILFNSGIGPTEQVKIVASGSTGVQLPAESAWISLPVGRGIKDHPIFTLKFSSQIAFSSLASTTFTNPSTTDIDMFTHGAGLLSQAGQRLNFWTSLETSEGTKFFQGTCNSPSNNTISMKVYLTHGLTSSGVLGITADGATTFTTQPWMNTAGDKEAVAAFIDTLLSYTRSGNSTLVYSASSTNTTGASLAETYISGSHFVASAKMGLDDGRLANGTAVVDLDAKVYGTDNLFVVDASFHPDVPTGNTQAIVMVAAEHVASRILALSYSATNNTAVSSPTVSSTTVAESEIGLPALTNLPVGTPFPISALTSVVVTSSVVTVASSSFTPAAISSNLPIVSFSPVEDAAILTQHSSLAIPSLNISSSTSSFPTPSTPAKDTSNANNPSMVNKPNPEPDTNAGVTAPAGPDSDASQIDHPHSKHSVKRSVISLDLSSSEDASYKLVKRDPFVRPAQSFDTSAAALKQRSLPLPAPKRRPQSSRSLLIAHRAAERKASLEALRRDRLEKAAADFEARREKECRGVIAPDLLETEEMVEQRERMERASFLEGYYKRREVIGGEEFEGVYR